MKNQHYPISLDQPAVYRIQLLGRLGREWSSTFDHFDLWVDYTENGLPVTTLQGKVADQPALHGLLQQVRDLGMVLLRVEWLAAPECPPEI